MQKINGKVFYIALIWLLVIGLLVYSRFLNLGWGLPYPMHPDERNMTDAIQQLSCKFPLFDIQFSSKLQLSIGNVINCFNPHFFAYGQLPLYLGYLAAYVIKFFIQRLGFPIDFSEAALGLRSISAIASIISIFLLVKIVSRFFKTESNQSALITVLMATLSPFFIQFSHFGTTESLLIMFYLGLINFSLLFIDKKISTINFFLNCGLLSGLAMATKISSAIFLIVPCSILIFNSESIKLFFDNFFSRIANSIVMIWIALVTSVIFSPHNLLNLNDFIGSISYESDVALGRSLVFYTRQFLDTLPIVFQLIKIFPYALGWPVFLIGLTGFFIANWKNRKINWLRFAFLAYFVPSSVIFAKWSRFMAPVLPIFIVFAILFLVNIKNFILKSLIKKRVIYSFIFHIFFYILAFVMVIPGLAYLSVYQNPDVRLQASDWIYKNIPNNANILSETANVVDIPISNRNGEQIKNYNVVSFNFYDLDTNPDLRAQLDYNLEKSDYIFVPSRRIFANHTCYGNDNLMSDDKCQMLKRQYPMLNKYYEDLFSGKLGYREVAEFDSFPKIDFSVGGYHFQWKLPDEGAEETWTVFDHPVIRIYKKI